MIFTKPIRVRLDEDAQKVSLSIRTSEEKVEVFRLNVSDFEVMLAEYRAQKQKE